MKWTLAFAFALIAAPLAAQEAPRETVGMSRVVADLTESMPNEPAGVCTCRALWDDPAIRDFVGLNENAWDFNSPERIPGFGPLTRSDGAR